MRNGTVSHIDKDPYQYIINNDLKSIKVIVQRYYNDNKVAFITDEERSYEIVPMFLLHGNILIIKWLLTDETIIEIIYMNFVRAIKGEIVISKRISRYLFKIFKPYEHQLKAILILGVELYVIDNNFGALYNMYKSFSDYHLTPKYIISLAIAKKKRQIISSFEKIDTDLMRSCIKFYKNKIDLI